MTRSYFIANVNDWGDLLDFCNLYDFDDYSDIHSGDELDEYVYDDIDNALGNGWTWEDIRDGLRDIDISTDSYFRYDGTFDYVYVDSAYDFAEAKADILASMDDGGWWDEEDEEDSADVFEDDDDEYSLPEEDICIDSLINMCGAELVSIRKVARANSADDCALSSLLAIKQ